jgi:hypothetical protein
VGEAALQFPKSLVGYSGIGDRSPRLCFGQLGCLRKPRSAKGSFSARVCLSGRWDHSSRRSDGFPCESRRDIARSAGTATCFRRQLSRLAPGSNNLHCDSEQADLLSISTVWGCRLKPYPDQPGQSSRIGPGLFLGMHYACQKRRINTAYWCNSSCRHA